MLRCRRLCFAGALGDFWRWRCVFCVEVGGASFVQGVLGCRSRGLGQLVEVGRRGGSPGRPFGGGSLWGRPCLLCSLVAVRLLLRLRCIVMLGRESSSVSAFVDVSFLFSAEGVLRCCARCAPCSRRWLGCGRGSVGRGSGGVRGIRWCADVVGCWLGSGGVGVVSSSRCCCVWVGGVRPRWCGCWCGFWGEGLLGRGFVGSCPSVSHEA